MVAKLRARLDALGIPHLPNPSHIVPVMVKDPVKCKMLSDILLDDYGIYVQPINYPTVAKGTERLRFTPSPLHTDADLDHLMQALAALWQHCALVPRRRLTLRAAVVQVFGRRHAGLAFPDMICQVLPEASAGPDPPCVAR